MIGFRAGGLWMLGLVCLAVGAGCACAADRDTKPEEVEAGTIPLDQIWALDMPGTRDIHSFFRDGKSHGQPLGRILQALNPKQPMGRATPGFAVISAEGWQTELYFARRVLESNRRSNSVPASEKVCAAFFSYASAYRVELEKVERRGPVIDIRYRLVPHQPSGQSDETAVGFALIPLGKLPAGDYRVEITQAPLEQQHLDAGFQAVSDEEASRIVCQPFSFEVWNLPEPDPGLGENAIEIPLDQLWASNMPGTRDIQSLDWEQLRNPYRPLRTGTLDFLERLGKDKAEPGFVVAGTGQEALIASRKKLPKGEKPSNSIPFGTEISIVYFSHRYVSSIDLHRVERRGNIIDVRYRFDVFGLDSLSARTALIPLGKLPAGKYRVNIIEIPPVKYQELPASMLVETHLRVCQSFTFIVEESNKEK